jgi:hypothetical protein
VDRRAQKPWWRWPKRKHLERESGSSRLSVDAVDPDQLAPVSKPSSTNLNEPDEQAASNAVFEVAKSPTFSSTARDPGVDLAVATAVLAVARRLTSPELQRRLTEAVRLLPDVSVIFPQAGDVFDPTLHTWESSAAALASDAAETVAETRSAGLLDHCGVVHRRAGVVVYDTKEVNHDPIR